MRTYRFLHLLAPALALLHPGAGFASDSADSARPSITCVRDLKDGTRVILVAVAPAAGERASAALTPSVASLGFSCPGVSALAVASLSPRLLLATSKTGVEKIYSYELGEDDGLPDELLDVGKIRSSVLLSNPAQKAISVAAWFTRSLPFKFFSKIVGLFGGRGERRRANLAAGTGRYLRAALESPQLREAAASDPSLREHLAEASGALRLRYGQDDGLAGIVTPRSQAAAYDESMDIKVRDHERRQLNALINRANHQGLVVRRSTEGFALLFVDCLAPPDLARYDGKELDVTAESLRRALERAKPTCSEANRLLPLSLYALSRDNRFVQVYNYQDPEQQRKRALRDAAIDVSQIAASQFVPGAGLALTAANQLVLADLYARSGSTSRLSRGRASGELYAEAELGELDYAALAPGELNEEQIRDSMKRAGKACREESREAERLLDDKDDPQRESRALLAMLPCLVSRGVGITGFARGVAPEELRRRAAAAWNKTTRDPERLDRKLGEVHRDLVNRDVREQERQAKRKRSIELAAARAMKTDLSRAPSALAPPAPAEPAVCTQKGGAVMVFMIDGLGKDQLERTNPADIPNIRKYILANGIQLDARSPHANTIPAWLSALSGLPAAVHGSATTTDASVTGSGESLNHLDLRDNGSLFGLLPYKGDPDAPTNSPDHYPGTQAYRALRARGLSTLADWVLDQRSVYEGYLPVNRGAPLPFRGLSPQAREAATAAANGSLEPAALFDLMAGYASAQSIRDEPGRYQLVLNWFGGVDHAGHEAPHAMATHLRAIDRAIGEVMAAAAADPCLSNAKILTVSDHGTSTGARTRAERPGAPGDDPEHENSTALDVAGLMAGTYSETAGKLNFRVGSHKAPDPTQARGGGVRGLFRKLFGGRSHTVGKRNPKFKGTKDGRNALVEPQGDRRATVHLLRDPKQPAVPVSYHRLRHFQQPGMSEPQDLPRILQEQTVSNTGLDHDPEERRELEARTGRRPVGHFVMPLHGDAALRSAVALAGFADPAEAAGARGTLREPVLVRAHPNRGALILTRDREETVKRVDPKTGKTHTFTRIVIEHAYVVVRGLDQAEDGTLLGEPVRPPEVARDVDPFGYEGRLAPTEWLNGVEIARRLGNLEHNTALVGAVDLLTLSPTAAALPGARDHVASFALFANQGFNFNPFQNHSGDHGGLTNDDSNSVMILSGPLPAECEKYRGLLQLSDEPVFLDEMAGLLAETLGPEAAQMPENIRRHQARSVLDRIRERCRQGIPGAIVTEPAATKVSDIPIPSAPVEPPSPPDAPTASPDRGRDDAPPASGSSVHVR